LLVGSVGGACAALCCYLSEIVSSFQPMLDGPAGLLFICASVFDILKKLVDS
jgi:hypothetical protein